MRYEMMKLCTESVWDTMRRWQLVIDDTGSAEGINAFIYCTNGDLIWCYRCLTNWLTDNFERWSYSAPYKVEEWSSRNAICKKAAEGVHIQLGGASSPRTCSNALIKWYSATHYDCIHACKNSAVNNSNKKWRVSFTVCSPFITNNVWAKPWLNDHIVICQKLIASMPSSNDVNHILPTVTWIYHMIIIT